MSIYSLPGLIAFTVNFSLAVIVLIDNPRQSLNRWFAAFIFSFSLWNIAEVIILNSNIADRGLFWGQILYRIIFLAPALFVIIAYQFPLNYHRWAKRPTFYLAVFSLPVLILSLSFRAFSFQLVSLKGIDNATFFQIVFSPHLSFMFLLLFSLAYVSWGVLVLLQKARRIRTIRSRNQTRFFAIGMIIVSIGFILVQNLPPLESIRFLRYFLSTMYTFLVAIFFFISIVQFHLFKPRKLLNSSLSYTILSAVVLAVYFLLIKSVSDSLLRYFQIDSFTFSGLLIFALVLFVQPFEKKLRTLIDHQLNKDIHQYRKNSLELFRELQIYAEVETFFKNIEAFLIKNFSIESATAFCLDSEDQSMYIVPGDESGKPAISTNSYLVKALQQKRNAIEYYELDHHLLESGLHSFFEDGHTQIILPLIFDKKLLGLMVFSRKKFKGEYSEDELEIFNIFARNIASALQRDNIIRDMRNHYKEHFQLEKLAALGQLTAGIAHEIRNPLSTISTSAETLLQPNIGLEDQEELKHFIIEEVERLNHVLTDFLNLSRFRSPELIHVAPQDLIDYLQLNLQVGEPDEAALSFEVVPLEATFISDPNLLKQILLNLGVNAQAAIQLRVIQEDSFLASMGHITCHLEIKKTLTKIVFRDNGVGIPKDAQAKVLEPFFTTKESGTGLGLSIVQTLVESLGGTISLKSQPGKTEFHIQLPSKLKTEYKESN